MKTEEKTAEEKALALKWVAQAKQGHEEAFGELYNLFFEKIYRFIYYRVSHKEVAEDLAEDVFLKAFAKIASVEKDASFEGWLYQIARNKIIDYYRDKRQTVALEEVENNLFYEENVLNILELKDNQKIFLQLLKELGPDQQLVIKLKFLENLENEEIAQIMEKNEGAIRVIQHRAISKLRELVEKVLGSSNN